MRCSWNVSSSYAPRRSEKYETGYTADGRKEEYVRIPPMRKIVLSANILTEGYG